MSRDILSWISPTVISLDIYHILDITHRQRYHWASYPGYHPQTVISLDISPTLYQWILHHTYHTHAGINITGRQIIHKHTHKSLDIISPTNFLVYSHNRSSPNYPPHPSLSRLHVTMATLVPQTFSSHDKYSFSA